MTVLSRQLCVTCGRIVYETGARHIIEAARDGDDPPRVEVLLRRLEESRRHRRELEDLAVRLEVFCRTGRLRVPRELNDLRDGIREIKVGKLRLPFFEVPGTEGRKLRLTHGFHKGTDRTPRKEINAALWVRKVDEGL